ncbi:LANO_0E10242g1_1 [Lachancea nothofagi CBS 11611]|uniref:tRNA (uracil-O(2)-)-methyltransferase n=1 Tax=Lachancea nothofagi CBS 11611 TaxID=1266666 RepID=A0A1G4JWR6_9SACH|nr:LANO_0E10242g1_1 [Lachancea nothofagi CBS 11611]
MSLQYGIEEPSLLGNGWYCMYKTNDKVDFAKKDFELAMLNVVRHPNINSTVILRADMLKEWEYDVETGKEISFEREEHHVADPESQVVNVDDLEVRNIEISADLNLSVKVAMVRRIIPRNPYKDAIINQTCLVLNSATTPETSLIVYTPHFDQKIECPFYIPHVKAVAILLHEGHLSVHYVPFAEQDVVELKDEGERVVRTARRLLQTAHKHSTGVKLGYEKKVAHDVVVDKVLFQDRYIALKKKHSRFLVDNWAESTDPKKHVFEDIAIAAFLIELWVKIYGNDFKSKMQFRDLGCGNGALCYVLILEGIKGIGIDARQRKSWKIYPKEVQKCLQEQVIIPSILLRPHPEVKKRAPELEHNGRYFPIKIQDKIGPATVVYSSEDLLKSTSVNVTEFPPETFIIGNHSDELTCWIPLLGYPFVVIPCCSHNFSGQRARYCVRKGHVKNGNSMYAGLVDRVDALATRVGWDVEKEMLRIPSTRNAAIVGTKNSKLDQWPTQEVYDTILEGGGADGWIENTMALTKKSPRSH